MTQEQHPIKPPPELVRQWMEAAGEYLPDEWYYEMNIATQAARWGSDQELEACCEWLVCNYNYPEAGNPLRVARRPKPLSLKEQALKILNLGHEGWGLADCDWNTLRRALEALPDD